MNNMALELFLRVGAKEIKEGERPEYEAIIAKLVGLALKARKGGILALEEDVNNESEPFLKIGLQLTIDGTEPSLIEEILCAHIIADNYRDFMKRIIMFQGVMSIGCADNPRILEVRVRSFLGEKFGKYYAGLFAKRPFVKAVSEVPNGDVLTQNEINSLLDGKDEKDVLKSSNKFEELMGMLDNMSVCRILKDVDMKSWVVALKGSSDEICDVIFRNMSARAIEMFKEEMIYLPPLRVKEVAEEKEKIMETIYALEEKGEIILKRR